MPAEEKNMVCRNPQIDPSKGGTQTPKTEVEKLETPFQHIALAFSGGGFRAASFALGTLSFFEEVPFKKDAPGTLLQNVTYLSSASGGTITTSTYALQSAQGKSFGEFYASLLGNLRGTDLMEEALKMLNDNRVWKEHPDKTRNIINSFALAYDKWLYQHEKVAALKAGPENTHLDEVCFNATELYRGLLFRQSVQMRPDPTALLQQHDKYLYGNFIVHLEHSAAERLRIADLLAASSCFPAGFEPIVFPRDFTTKDAPKRYLLDNLKVEPQKLSEPELTWLYGDGKGETVFGRLSKPCTPKEFQKALQQEPLQDNFNVCLMDGGITDNQGLESIILANKRRIEGKSDFKPFDLMMICDVSSHYMNAYQLPDEPKKRGFWNISRLLAAMFVLFGASLAGILLPWKGIMDPHCCALTLIAAGAAAGIAAFVSLFKNKIGSFIPLFVVATALIVLGLSCDRTGSDTCKNLLIVASILTAFISLVVIILVFTVRTFISGKVRGGAGLDLNKNFSEKIVNMLFRYFRHLPFNMLAFMLEERATSVLTLNNDVFLKRIRFLLYDQFFNQDNVKATGRLKANHIYDLTFTNDANRCKSYTPSLDPSIPMQKVAELAFNMSTTLWFAKEDDKHHSLAAIVATGQFTTCYNLLDYIAKLKKHYPGEPDSVYNGLSAAQKVIVDDIEAWLNPRWEQFREDPFWLYNKLGSAIPGFKPVSAGSFAFPKDFRALR